MFKWLHQTYLNRFKFEESLWHDTWKAINENDVPTIAHALELNIRHPNITKYLMKIPGVLDHCSKHYPAILSASLQFYDTKNEQIIYDLIGAKVGINWSGSQLDGYTEFSPLMKSISQGMTRVVTKLLDNGADITKKFVEGVARPNKDFFSWPLHKAVSAKNNAPEIIQILIDRGAKIDQTDFDGNTAIDKVNIFSNDAIKITETLVNNGANIHTIDPDKNYRFHGPSGGNNFLHKFMNYYDSFYRDNGKLPDNNLLEFYLSQNVDPKVFNRNGNTALHLAARSQYMTKETMDILFKYHPNLIKEIDKISKKHEKYFKNAMDKLHQKKYIMVKDKLYEILKWPDDNKIYCFSPPTQPLVDDYQKHTSYDLASLLQPSCGDLVFTDLKGYGNMHLRNGKLDSIIYENELSIEIKPHRNLSPIQAATVNHNIVVMTSLIEHGANLDELDYSGENLLALAVRSGNIDAVRLIHDQGFDIDSDDYGASLLKIASEMLEYSSDLDKLKSTLEMMRVLVEYGAKTNLYSSDCVARDYFNSVNNWLFHSLKPYSDTLHSSIDADTAHPKSTCLADNPFSQAIEPLCHGKFSLYTLYKVIEKIKALCKSKIDPDTANSDGTHWVDTFATCIIGDLDLDDRSGFEKPENREEIYLIGHAD